MVEICPVWASISSDGIILRVRDEHIAVRIDGNSLGPIELCLLGRSAVA